MGDMKLSGTLSLLEKRRHTQMKAESFLKMEWGGGLVKFIICQAYNGHIDYGFKVLSF